LADVNGLCREAIEAIPAAIYMTDAEGRITFYNEAAAALWGCRPELGDSKFCGSWKLYWPDGTPLPHDQCPMAMALHQKRPIRGMEAVAERPDGTRVPFIPYGQKILTARQVGQLCHSAWARRALSVTFFGAINGAHCEPAGKWGSSWSGHASWPTSAGR